MRKLPFAKLPSVGFLKKLGLWSVIGFVVFTLFGFFALPFIVKAVLTSQLQKVLHREAAIQEVHFNPFSWILQIRGFSLKERESPAPFLTFDELALDVEAASLWWRGPIVRDVLLKAPHLSIIRNEDQTYNFSDLLAEFSATPETSPEPPPPAKPLFFSINNIRLEGGSIDFDDRPQQAQHTVRDLNIGIPFLSNLPVDIDVYTQPALALKVNGTPIELTGKSKPFSGSRETSLNIDMTKIELPKYLEYVPADLRFKLNSGSLTTKLALAFVQHQAQASSLAVQGTIALDQFAMTDLTDQPLLTLPHLEVPIEAADVFARKAQLGTILLQGPEVWTKLDKTGVLNLTTLVGEKKSPSPTTAEQSPNQPAVSEKPDPPPQQATRTETVPQGTEQGESPSMAVEVAEIRVADGKLYFRDETPEQPFETTLNAVNVSIKQFNTDQTKPFTVEAAITSAVGEVIKQAATVTLSPLTAEGNLEVQGVPVSRYAPYYAKFLLFDIQEGLVDLSTKYAYAKEENSTTLSGLTTTLKSLRLKKRGEKDDFLTLATFAVKQAEFDLAKRTLTIEEVATGQGRASVRREKDGTINVATLTPARTVATKAVPVLLGKETAQQKIVQEPSVPPWTVVVKKIALDQYAVRFDDFMPPQPVTLIAEPFSLIAENFSTEKESQLKAALRLTLNKTGTLVVEGPLRLAPLSATLKVTGNNLNVLPLRPYFADRLKIAVTSGIASADGTLVLQTAQTAQTANDGPLNVSYTGRAAVTKLSTLEKTTSEDFLKWKSLSLAGINVHTSPFRLTIDEVALADFYSRLVLNPDATLNVQGVVVSEQATTRPAAQSSTKAQAPADAQSRPTTAAPTPVTTAESSQPIKIAKVVLQGGTVDFTDRSIQPNYSARLKQLKGQVSGLTSEEAKPADVDLHGTLNDVAPLEIVGKVSPLSRDLYVDLTMNMREVELNQMTPYSGKYAGYAIQKGKLSLGLKYLITNRQLQSENKIVLDQLTFGDTVNSPDATSLPVRLAVSLLKDRNGVIMLNLPVTGSLDDPQFSVWGTIVQMLTNLIAKAAVAPFALIGAAIGGGSGEEMNQVEFAYGSAALDAAAEEKVNKLSAAFADRPSLALDISGYVEKEKDREGLRRYRFERKLKAQKVGEEGEKETEEGSLDHVTISQDEYLKYLTLAYKNESFQKPRNLIGLAKSLPQEEMENLMLAHIEVTDDDLHELAQQRAGVVKEQLLKSGNIDASRIFLVEPSSIFAESTEVLKGSRVDFAVK